MGKADPTKVTLYRPIPNYPGYMVGSDGSVWSKRQQRLGKVWRRLRPGTNTNGYLYVVLANRRGPKNHLVSRLVLTVFVGDQPHLECCHCDGSKTNNQLGNLKWGTHADNMRDMVQHGRSIKGRRHRAIEGENHWNSRLSVGDVKRIREMLSSGPVSLESLADSFGVSAPNIAAIRDRKTWKHV